MPIKSIRQQHTPNPQQMQMMETFRQMVNCCIRIGLEHNKHTLKTLSPLAYHKLSEHQIQSKYKLTAISQACGRLSQMKRDIKNGRTPKSPFVRKPYLVSCYGFKINGVLLSFPAKNRTHCECCVEVGASKFCVKTPALEHNQPNAQAHLGFRVCCWVLPSPLPLDALFALGVLPLFLGPFGILILRVFLFRVDIFQGRSPLPS
jgi:hypothetical protein